MTLSIIVLAAGKGSRMNSSLPKVFHEVGSYPMINHVLDTVQSLKPQDTITVISDDLNEFKKKLSEKYKRIKFATQKNRDGTADAVKVAMKQFKCDKTTNTIILYGDTPLIDSKTLKKALNYFKKNSLDLCVLSMLPKSQQNSYGRLYFDNGMLSQIIEKVEITKDNITKCSDLCNTGIMIFNTKKLNENIAKVKNNNKKKEFYLTDLVNIFYHDRFKTGHFICSEDECKGVNNMVELSSVNKIFQRKKRDFYLEKGVNLIDDDSVYFSYDTKIGRNVLIQPHVFFGKGVDIGSNVVVKSFCHIENTKIYSNSTVGPFARLRDNTTIKSGTKVGNFVEIKKSNIHKDVKISHLSYIGDAVIKDRTNIGAGSITCNYDGIKKNKTLIGSDCFIGSNTSLIAPLEINKNTTIGAGTIINKNTSANSLIYRKSELIRKEKKKK